MRFPVRFLSFLLLLFLSLFVLKNVAFAQTIPTNTNPDVPNNLHNLSQNVMIEVVSSLSCLLAGIDPINPQGKCLGIDLQTHKIGYVEGTGGAIGAVGGLIAMTFTPPIHTGDYLSYLGNNFGITKKAYAADNNGVGFAGISPLLKIWEAFRNLTYLIFVIVFIVIGFAIMLRVHIDPRTVMTIENQIPKIIIALILVTFSFAIAGFLIDLMYVGIYLVTNIFASIDPAISKDIVGVTNPIQAANTIGGLGDISQNSAKTVGGFLAPLLDNNSGRLFTSGFLALIGALGGNSVIDLLGGIAAATGQVGLIPILIAAKVTGIGTSIVSGLLAIVGGVFAPQIAGLIGFILAFVVIIIAILFALFRLWFALLQAYVFLLIDIILVPFWILAGLLPGSNLNFTSWLRETGGEIIAFPATIVMFLLGKVLMDAFTQTDNPFIPPLIGNPAGHMIGNFIGLGIILMTPNVVNMMKGWLKAPKFDITAIAQALAGGVAYTTNVPKQIGSTISSSQEVILKKGATEAQPRYGSRGGVRAFFGNFLR